MKNIYVKASYDVMEAYQNSIGPAIQLSFDLSLAKTGSSGGANVSVLDTATRLDILDARVHLYVISPQGQHLFLCEGAPQDWYPIVFHIEGASQRITVFFQLRPDQISLLEDLRKGGKLQLRASLRILAATDEPTTMVVPPAIEIRKGSSQFIEVEKSKWVDDILPRLGWGSWRTIEIPFSADQAGLTKIDEILVEAQKQYGLGNWADCLTAFRRAVEELRPYAKDFVNLAHTDEKGGTAPEKIEELTQEFENLSKSMIEFQAGVRKMLAAGAHKLPPGAALERADAELGLLLAIALRRYVGLRMQKKAA